MASALNSTQQIEDKEKKGRDYGVLGKDLFYRDEYYKAIECHQMHLNIAKEIGDQKGEGHAYGNLGVCYEALGKCDKAMNHYEKVLEIARRLGDKESEGRAYGNLGNCFELLGLSDDAVKNHERALKLASEIRDKLGEGSAYGNLGSCYYSRGQYKKAIEHHEKQLKIAKQIKDKNGEGIAYGNTGICYMSLGEYPKAIKYCKMQLDIAKLIGDKSGEGAAYGNFGSCYFSLGQYDEAIKYDERHLTIAQQTEEKAEEASAYYNLGQCYSRLKQYSRAEINCRKSITCYEELFDNTPKQDSFKVSIRDTFIFVYRLLIMVLLLQDKKEEALVIAEKGRSNALTELMFTSYQTRCSLPTEAKDLELHGILDVVKGLGSTVLFYALIPICTRIFRWVIQPNGDVKTNWAELSQQDKNEASKDDFFLYVENLNLKIKNAVKSLRSGYTVLCEDRSSIKPRASVPSSATHAELLRSEPDQDQALDPTTAPSTEETTTTTSNRLAGSGVLTGKPLEKAELHSLLNELYKTFLGSVRQFVQGSLLVVVPDGPLPLVPFAALVDETGHYVAESLQIRLVPSFTTARIIMKYPQAPEGQARPLIVGDPAIHSKRLPGANEEVKIVGKLLKVQDPMLLTAEKATKQNFLENLENANLIHIAAHGHEKKGDIFLAPEPEADGENSNYTLLTISDPEEKRTRAKLVVLSCCHSGCGEVRAEGVIGIARAFLGAGAHAVLVALWAIDDEATLYFMTKFYEHLSSGKRASESIYRAMKAMRETEKLCHPRLWAPFVLIGEDVTLV